MSGDGRVHGPGGGAPGFGAPPPYGPGGGPPAPAPYGPGGGPGAPHGPAGPGPYGPGGTPGAPYGPPGGPVPPAPYGPPGGSWPPPVPPAPPTPPRRGRTGTVLGLVLVLLAVAGAGLYWAYDTGRIGGYSAVTIDTGQSPEAAEYGIGEEYAQEWISEDASTSTVDHAGMLVGAETAARVFNNRIVGYNLDTGTALWTIKADPGLELCATSETTDKNIGAILYRDGSDGPCTNAVAVDLDSGKQLWNKPLQSADVEAGPLEPAIGITEGVVVAGTVEAPVALDARTGRKLWTGRPQPVEDGNRQLDHVKVQGSRVIASYAGTDDKPEALILQHYPKDGTVLNKLTGPDIEPHTGAGTDVLFLSIKPLVIRMPEPDASAGNIYYAHTGKKWQRLRTEDVGQGASDSGQQQHGVVAGGKLIKSYQIDDMDMPIDTDTMIAAFDLETGKVAWKHALKRGTSSAVFLPPAMDDDAVRAIVPGHEVDLQFYAFPVRDGTPVRGGRIKASESTATSEGTDFHSATRAALQGDRLILLSDGQGLLGCFSAAAGKGAS